MTLLSRALIVTVVLLTTPLTTTGTASADTGCTSSVPYVSGEGDYDTYRIPATITTPHGTVLAFAEGGTTARATPVTSMSSSDAPSTAAARGGR